jgi:diguanylate cyclase
MTNILEILSGTDIFSRLSKRDLSIIAGYSKLLQFQEGDVVFTEGDPGTELYIVHRGEISISRRTKEEKTLELARFIEGDLFGELDFFQNSSRNADARAETATSLLQFPKEGFNFNDILTQHPAISAELLHSFLTIIAGRIRGTNKLVSENSPVIRELRKQMYGDKLTGLYNRTYLEEQLQSFFENERPPVSLLMVKPDNFKYINDKYGHEAGDQTLRILAGVYRKLVKPKDGLVRFMGNEFGFVLTGTGRKDAAAFTANLQRTIAELDLSEITGEKNDFRLTVSTGIAVYPEHGQTALRIIEQAHELPLIGRARGGGKILFPEDK